MMIHDMEIREEGRAEGALKMLVNLVKQGLLSPENAAKQANMTVAEFEKQAALLPV
jgi:predicted HTH domain antitoxin